MSSEHRAKRPGLRFASVCAAVAACAAGAAQAQLIPMPEQVAKQMPNVRIVNMPQAVPAAAPASSAGMRAYIDPATGALTQSPVPAQVADLQDVIDASRVHAKRTNKPFLTKSGAIGAVLGEEHMMYAVAVRADDGSVDWACVDDQKKALDALSSGKALGHAGHDHATPVKGRAVK